MEKSVENSVENSIGILRMISDSFDLPERNAAQLPGLTLAYVGDCIFELVIRTLLVGRGLTHVNDLHREASHIVNASSQSDMLHKIEDKLTDTEMAVFKRGRNVKTSSPSKNASIRDYRIATGFEALMGYLYMNEEYERIIELIRLGLSEMELL